MEMRYQRENSGLEDKYKQAQMDAQMQQAIEE
jgi:hypothetical protein